MNISMDEYSRFPMERTCKILRRSVFAFLQNYQYFTTTVVFLAFPFAASTLVSQAFVPSSSLLLVIHSRLRSLFEASGIPLSSEFVTVLNLKLSQTIATSFLVLPFTLTFLLFAKAAIIRVYSNTKSSPHSSFMQFISVYKPLLITQLCNFILILSANATCLSTLFCASNIIDGLGLGFSNPKYILFLSSAAGVFYSIILANALIISNLALILSGMEKHGGYIAILEACIMIRGRSGTALSLVLPVNMAMASVEALFQYRIVRAYYQYSQTPFSSTCLESMFIAYLYAILLVIDTIVGCEFYKSCTRNCRIDHKEKYSYRIQVEEKERDALLLVI